MRIPYVLGLLAFVILPSTLAAQGGCPALEAGSTVRLHGPSAATYTLTQSVKPSDTEIVLPPAGGTARAPLPCADVRRVELRAGSRSRVRSGLRGAGIGLLVGGVIGAGLGYLSFEEDDSGWEILSREETTLLGAVYLGGVTAVAGGVIGYAAPGSRWQDVPVGTRQARSLSEGLHVVPEGGSRVRLSYTISF